MSPYQRKPNRLNAPPKTSLGVVEAWNSSPEDFKPPPPNKIGNVPLNRLVYLLDHLDNLFYAIAVDSDVATNIQRITPPFDERDMTRKKITLNLMGEREVFSVDLWVIPVFLNGVLVAQVYAADDENQDKLMNHRPPVKTDDYDISRPQL